MNGREFQFAAIGNGPSVSTVRPRSFSRPGAMTPGILKLKIYLMADPHTDMVLFSEALLKLLSQFGYRGVSGVFVNANNNPVVLRLWQPGEPGGMYEIIGQLNTSFLSQLSYGKPSDVRGEAAVGINTKSTDTSEMPF